MTLFDLLAGVLFWAGVVLWRGPRAAWEGRTMHRPILARRFRDQTPLDHLPPGGCCWDRRSRCWLLCTPDGALWRLSKGSARANAHGSLTLLLPICERVGCPVWSLDSGVWQQEDEPCSGR